MTVDVRDSIRGIVTFERAWRKLMQVEACLSTSALRGLLLDVGMNDV